ncbi:hypothetical protein M9458_043119, partial [Cirrhinus mrigala]
LIKLIFSFLELNSAGTLALHDQGSPSLIYMDNICFDSLETHVGHVRAILQRLIFHQVNAKAEKCEFHQTSTTFLGYVVSPEGVPINEVQAILNWLRPTTVKEMQ